MSEILQTFFTQCEEDGLVYLDIPTKGMRCLTVRDVFREQSSILLRVPTNCREALSDHSTFRAKNEAEDSGWDAKLVRDRQSGRLAKFEVKQPDYRPSREDSAVEIPENMTGEIDIVTGREVEGETQREPVGEVDVGRLSLGFVRVSGDEQSIQFGDNVAVRLFDDDDFEIELPGVVVDVDDSDSESRAYTISINDLDARLRGKLFVFLEELRGRHIQT